MISPRASSEIKWVAALLVAGFLISFAAIKVYRAQGNLPRFYQENFGPAVMMTCGHGFTAPSFHQSPPELFAFLRVERNDFDCAMFPATLTPEVVTWNGTWFYLYGTVSLVWRLVGITWTSLDVLSAAMGGIALAALFGLFRLICGRPLAALAALAVSLSPSHLDQVPMLRDFSKAPFVLLAILVLGWLVLRPLGRRAAFALALLYGVIVGLGIGFRSDVIVMLPFGLIVMVLLLPGRFRDAWPRNLMMAAVALLAFVVAGYPPLKGQQTGGCQFHYSLLGLTAPPVRNLNVDTPIYAFGDHFLDTFIDLKVGDYSARVMGQSVPNLCAPEYDRASAEMFFGLARTFPADIVTHAYGSAMTVLRAGFTPPRLERALGRVPYAVLFARPFDRAAYLIGALGPIVTAIAVAVAWSAAPRFGIALTIFVLFLTGYPAIEFESRHFFHLRFIPVWALLLVGRAWLRTRPELRRSRIRSGAIAVAGLLVAMGMTLAMIRWYQRGPMVALYESYLAAPTEPLPTAPASDSIRLVDWRSIDFAPPPGHRSSDMLVITVSAAGCGDSGPLDLRVGYDVDGPGHDVSSVVRVQRGAPGSAPTQVFFPVFSQAHLDHSYLRFSKLETLGRPADCISSVARFADRAALPLWIQAQAPPDWRDRSLFQSLSWRRFIVGPS